MLCSRDHPRVCGEHIEIIDPSDVNAGSSPRMRGTPSRGNCAWCRRRDHPRVCGEHLRGLHALVAEQGSSPRMRGTPADCRFLFPEPGIIPAYAGNTRHQADRKARSGDHPRVCGEHGGGVVFSSPSMGSSPRMRGTPTGGGYAVEEMGIIPAYAGNTTRP